MIMGKIDPKSTGGEGFDFEDKIGAYFLSFLLVGKNPFPSLPLGRFTTIKFQRKVDGWEFDDIILEFNSSNIEKKIAFSVKSNSYITANKFPTDLVESIWKQFCKTERNPFRSKYDYLGLATSGTSTEAIETYRKLHNFASKHKGRDLEIHIKRPGFTNQQVRNLFDSFVKPSVINCNQNIQRAEIVERLIHFDVNLDDPTSPYLRNALDNLASAIGDEANDLWIKLQHIVKESRTVSGEITFSLLIKELNNSFKIKGHYNLASDLEKLKDLQETEIGKIKSTIGSNFSVERKMNFSEKFKKEQINAFIGESGIGKSVLLKQWVCKAGKPVIWLPYSIFNARTLVEMNTLLGIKNDLFDILQYGPSEQIIVIDAVDRLTSTKDRELLKSFLVKFQKTSRNRHLCVISSQDQIWETLAQSLSTQEVLFNVISAPVFEEDELRIVENKFPNFRGILKERSTREILKNLKYLDIAVQMAEQSLLDINRSISEPVLIRGFWSLLSDGGANQKQVLLTKLAINQADRNDFLSSFEDLSIPESHLVDILVREGILKIQDGYIQFSHDLYGDWIRQRFLLSKRTKTIHEILRRKNNVYWQQSIRLASLEILESDGFDSWKKEIESLKEKGDDVLVDLFLDIAITPLNQRFILETIKELLFSDKFKVLDRFLKRFLAYATVPNPQIMNMRKELDLDELTVAQIDRVPLYNYWPNLLQFLAENFENTIRGRVQMSQIAETWLRFTPNNFPFRKEVAEIAFNCAKWIFEFKRTPHNYLEDDAKKKCYQALLVAYPELPNEIEDLCLKLIGLREDGIERPPPTVIPSDSKIHPPIQTFPTTRRRIEKKVLPNGPQFKKDRKFRDVCLEGQTFCCLIQFNPSLASQVLLASIIDAPQEYEDLYDDGQMDKQLGTDYTQKFYPPLYSKGPFMYFLKTAPQQALDALISLISLVTDQWAERAKKRGNDVFGFEIEINGNKKFWRGDAEVFLWAMDRPDCPDVVVAFLMALEKWLYKKVDAKEDIDFWIDQIVEKSDSLALIGILVSVAKYSPKLFLEKLQFLLVLPYVIWWDQQFLLRNRLSNVSMISRSLQDRFMINLAIKWFEMEHRKISVEQWAINLLLNTPKMQKLFATARSNWKKELQKQPNRQLESLVCKFNPDNYKIGQLPDGTQVWNYTVPSDLSEKHKERLEEDDVRRNMFMFPTNVDKLLDADSFSKDEFVALVSTMKNINNTVKNKSNDSILTTLKDCNLAIDGLTLIAVKRKVILFDATTLNTAKKKIERALESLWNNHRVVGYSFDRSHQKYEILAKVIGQLAEGNEEDIWIRKQVAHLVCSSQANLTNALIKSAVLAKVEHAFLLEIMTLFFEYSKICTAWHNVDFAERFSHTNQKSNVFKTFSHRNSFLRNKVFRAYTLEDRRSLFRNEVFLLVKKFINGNSAKAWPDLDFNPYDYEFTRGLKLPKTREDIIHLEDFTKASSYLPPMEHWNDNLLAGWINFCTSHLDQISRRLSKSIEEHGDVKDTPYEQDRWIIKEFATTYYWHDDAKLDQSLRTFFEVGADGHYWIDDFGEAFFELGLKNPKYWKQLKSKMQKIFDLALSVNQLQSSQKSWDADKIWCSLVGLDDTTIQFLPEDSKPLITDLLPLYKRLIDTRSDSIECISRFIALLCKGATMNIRLKGLAIVASELKGIDYAAYWQKPYISKHSYFLTTLWRENQNELRNDKIALANFQQILNGLISVQDPTALELASQINSSRLSSE